MTRKRADSFKIALDTLREELRAGVHSAGSRLTANDIAERLSLSQTPVREALSRLAGEGLLLDRRGQGLFVQSLAEQSAPGRHVERRDGDGPQCAQRLLRPADRRRGGADQGAGRGRHYRVDIV